MAAPGRENNFGLDEGRDFAVLKKKHRPENYRDPAKDAG